MGKDSEYYKDKKKQQTLKYRELLKELPGFAVDYLYDKEVSSEIFSLYQRYESTLQRNKNYGV